MTRRQPVILAVGNAPHQCVSHDVWSRASRRESRGRPRQTRSERPRGRCVAKQKVRRRLRKPLQTITSCATARRRSRERNSKRQRWRASRGSVPRCEPPRDHHSRRRRLAYRPRPLRRSATRGGGVPGRLVTTHSRRAMYGTDRTCAAARPFVGGAGRHDPRGVSQCRFAAGLSPSPRPSL